MLSLDTTCRLVEKLYDNTKINDEGEKNETELLKQRIKSNLRMVLCDLILLKKLDNSHSGVGVCTTR